MSVNNNFDGNAGAFIWHLPQNCAMSGHLEAEVEEEAKYTEK